MVYIDGFPLIVAGWLLGNRLAWRHRSTAVDWLPALIDSLASEQRSWCHVGGAPGTAEEALRRLAVTGRIQAPPRSLMLHGHFDTASASADSNRIIKQINDFAPDLLTIGLGMPKQEIWCRSILPHIRVPVVLVIGATLDYFCGAQKLVSRKLAGIGLEGVMRLIHNPRRLGYRYLIEPWSLLEPFCSDMRQRFRR